MVEKQEKRNQERLKRREEREKEERMRRRWVLMLKSRWHLQQCVFYCLTLGFYFIGQDQGAESTEGKEAPSSVCQFIRSSLLWVRFVLFKSANEICCLLSLPGPVLVTAEGDAHALRHETGAVPAHAPGRGGDGIAADPAHAAEDTVTATSRAPDTSKHRRKPLLIYTPVKENWANTWRSVGYWLRRLRTVSENKRKQQLHGLFLSPLSSFKLVFWHFTHTILLFFFQLLCCICVTNLNISYRFVAQVVQRSRALIQGPWPLIQRPVTGARQKGWYERQVGLAQGRRQRRGGPLKTKLHPWPQHHSLLPSVHL